MTTQTVPAVGSTRPATDPTTWFGPLLNHSGFGEEMRGFVSGLRAAGTDVSARAYGVSERYVESLTAAQLRCWRDALAEPDSSSAVQVFHGPVCAVRRSGDAAYQIARTMFETDGLPAQAVAHLNTMDEVWVASSFNVTTFRAAGVHVPIHVVPSGVDPQAYRPGLAPLDLPGLRATVFLSVFGWSDRKGWDVLLSAWARAFDQDDDVTLLIRSYPADDFDGASARDELERRIDAHLRSVGTDRGRTAPIVLLPDHFPDDQMPRLYATADAFVLPTRGEGWGRPFLESMSCGVPVIATAWGAHLDFVDERNGLLIASEGLEDIGPDEPVEAFHGQRWAQPSRDDLVRVLRTAAGDRRLLRRLGAAAREDVLERWTWDGACDRAGQLLHQAHASLRPAADAVAPSVRWVGDLRGEHSLAIVNRELCSRIAGGGAVELVTELADARPRTASPLSPGPTRVEVRHAWPPDWSPPADGAWVVMQPWEFGGLPDSWLPALRSQVDEVWCYTDYVRDLYVRSGVPAERLRLIPLGVDAQQFRPDGPVLALETDKRFKLLFVGGAITRKGIDVLLSAYSATFTAADDVCLVVKTAGADSFYRGQALDEVIAARAADPSLPAIELIDRHLSADEVAALYRACDVLVHPYRGEGFGLPVAEAMASGLPVVVTDRGACRDFCDETTAFLVPSTERSLSAVDGAGASTAGYSWAEPDPSALGDVLREIVRDPSEARRRAVRGRQRILSDFTWDAAAEAVQGRLVALAEQEPLRHRMQSLRDGERQRAEQLYGAGDLVGAAKVLLELSQRFERDPGILSDLGVVSVALEAPEDALALFDSALDLDATHVDARANHDDLLSDLAARGRLAVTAVHLLDCRHEPPSARPALRLNLGAGDDRREGYLSVDLREDTADVVADVRSLPFPDGSVDEVLAFDVLEHFWKDQTERLLAEWRRVLRVGGLLQLKVPNLLALAQHLDGPYHESIVENIYGGHRWGPDGAYDTHHWGWTPRTLRAQLAGAGYTVVSNDEALNMTVRALRL